VEYRSKDGKETRLFDAPEWLVPLIAGCSHVPNKGEQADFAIVAYGYDG